MHITELEDLRVKVVDDLQEAMNVSSLLEEDLITKAGTEVSMLTSRLVDAFSSEKSDLEEIKVLLKKTLDWSLLASFIFGVDTPLIEDLLDNQEEWSEEIVQCNILSALALQSNFAQLTVDYFIQEEVDLEYMEEKLNNVWSLLHVMCSQINISFLELLQQ